ncbi:MAG: hypothetical protein WDN48_00145 [Pseudolabrys sp.]
MARPYHFQIGQIAAAKGFDVASVTLKPVQSIDAMARARRHRRG